MTNQKIHEDIVELEKKINLNDFTLNKQNKEYINKIQNLRKLCTHKNNSIFALNDKGYCIYCGAMINDCN